MIRKLTAILYEITNHVLCICAIKTVAKVVVGHVGRRDVRCEMMIDIIEED